MALTKVKNVLDITADTMVDLLSAKHKKGSVQLLGYHERGDGGGGVFYWDADKPKTEHNGGTVIDPTVSFPATWSDTAQQELWFTAPASGTGCWVREYSGAVNVKWFGAKGDGVSDDTLANLAANQEGNPTAFANIQTFTNEDAEYLGNDVKRKELIAQASRPSISSMPNLLKKLSKWNDVTSTEIKVVGMGSSVAVGAVVGADNAPVFKLNERLNEKFNKLGNITFDLVNESVNGSIVTEGLSIIDSILAAHNPDVLLLAYGMNDQGYLQYYSGQTYPSVYRNLLTICEKAQAVGCDVIITTSPHAHTSSLPTSFNPSIPAIYPESFPAPVDGEALTPRLSELPVTADWLGTGQQFTQSYLAYRVNQAMRNVAVQLGIPIIDAEYYWFEAVASFGEDSLYTVPETVHPNLLGHRQSYWRGIFDFVDSISESYQSGAIQNSSVSPRLGINVSPTGAALEVQTINGTDNIVDIKDSSGVTQVLVNQNGGAEFNSDFIIGNNSSATDLVMQSYGYKRSFVTRVMSNRNISTPLVLTTVNGQFGEIAFQGYHSGIGTQLRKFAYFNVGGTITITPDIYYLETASLDVFTVVLNGNDIELTPFTSNSDIDIVWNYS